MLTTLQTTKSALVAKLLDEKRKRKRELLAKQRYLFTTRKASAIQNGQVWTLCFTDLSWPKRCPITGNLLNYFAVAGSPDRPMLVRKYPEKGFIPGNVRVMSRQAANQRKSIQKAKEARWHANGRKPVERVPSVQQASTDSRMSAAKRTPADLLADLLTDCQTT